MVKKYRYNVGLSAEEDLTETIDLTKKRKQKTLLMLLIRMEIED